jgi:hypothetical protein
MRFKTYKGCSYERNKLKKHILDFAGQTKSFCGPHLVLGPYALEGCEANILNGREREREHLCIRI